MISLFILSGKDRAELAKIIAPYVSHERFEGLKKHRHHVFFNRHEHLIHTASLCYRMAKFVNADVETCVLAGLLHDFHETRVKGYEHGLESAGNAISVGLANEHALDIIRAHMFPLGFGKVKVPKTREYAVLKIADSLAATVEVTYGFFHSVAVMSLNHSRVRFAETRDMYVRIAAEIERSAEQAKETLASSYEALAQSTDILASKFERSLETAKIVVETAINPPKTREI